jgi:hypothetical protein
LTFVVIQTNELEKICMRCHGWVSLSSIWSWIKTHWLLIRGKNQISIKEASRFCICSLSSSDSIKFCYICFSSVCFNLITISDL